ncbi:MAG TPA: heavy metal translocating P-type ATPase [Candidatus Dormibacteraeota bacterium]|nr:heavy metal translocating P-type ATPase [Candidatus Dormibacteraeota bacterium]
MTDHSGGGQAKRAGTLADEVGRQLQGAPGAGRPDEAEGGPQFQQIQLSIRGMSCGACAAKIERSLNQLDHVSAQVNYASERATVSLFSAVPVQQLIKRVEAVGYGAELSGTSHSAADDAAEDDRRVRYLGRRLLVAALLFMPLGEWSTAFSLLPWLRFPGWQWLFIAMGAPVVIWAAWPFHRAALRAARHGSSTMDTLVSMGITAATGWSVYAMFFRDFSEPGRSGLYVLLHQGGGALYLDVAAGVTTFLLAGRYFEALARRRAGNALRALAEVGAKDVSILQENESERRLPVAQLRLGDRFIVRPGETIATDGQVILGQSGVDCSSMTGESVPIEVGEGQSVLGGTVVVTGRLIVRATKVGVDTQLAHMVALVEQAQVQKASVQRLADRISGVFVPAVIALAILTFIAWMVLAGSAESAFSASLSVLIIACPCALGLATPAALRVASGRGAQLGIFFKGHQGLETSRTVDTVVLDKTGTVTQGKMELAEMETVPGVERSSLLHDLGALEQASEHAVAAAITAAARAEFPVLPQPADFLSLPGLGAIGVVDGRQVLVGRSQLLNERGVSIPQGLAARCRGWEVMSHTVALVARDGEAIGAVAVADIIKPTAAPAIHKLQQLGLNCILVTGDNEATARAVAAEVGISDVVAGSLPAEKVRIIRELQAQGHSVAMVGDGVNDGPALVQADLGLAIGSGADVALNAADLILVRDDLSVVPDSLRLARRTIRTIRGNLLWAFGYNVVAIPLAALGRLDPLIAGGAMALSSAFVVWNSSRLRHFEGSIGTGRPQHFVPASAGPARALPDFAE